MKLRVVMLDAEGDAEMLGKALRRVLSPKAQNERRPPHPALLLDASHERPDLPAKVRIAKPMRVPRKKD